MTQDLCYTELEEQLRDGLRRMLADRCPPSAVLAHAETGAAYDPELWRLLAVDMGLAGLAVPEGLGGAGAGWRETAVVLEELGRAMAPVPYLTSAVVATQVLLALPDSAEALSLLPALASGARTAALLPVDQGIVSPQSGRISAQSLDQREGRVTGEVGGATDVGRVDVLLVVVGEGLYAVDREGPGVRVCEVVSLDATRPLYDVSLTGAPGRPLATGPQARAAVRAGLMTGTALLASEQLGAAQWCLDTTVAYLKERVQFGRPVGSFQAVKHRLADLWAELAQARAVARYAAACVASGDGDAPVAASLAAAYCSEAAVRAAEECVQLHGGIGFTWEHPAHLYLKRARASAVAFGTAAQHRAVLAELAGLPVG